MRILSHVTTLLRVDEPGTNGVLYNTIHDTDIDPDSRCHIDRITKDSAGGPILDHTMALDSRALKFGGTGNSAAYEGVDILRPADRGVEDLYTHSLSDKRFNPIQQARFEGTFEVPAVR
jgi:hypothetical protein